MLAAIFQILVGALISTILLRAAAKWVLNEHILFGMAFFTMLISYGLSSVLGFVLGFVAVGLKLEGVPETVMDLAVLPLSFLIQSWVISFRLKSTFGQACLMTLIMFGLILGIGLFVGLVGFVVMQFGG